LAETNKSRGAFADLNHEQAGNGKLLARGRLDSYNARQLACANAPHFVLRSPRHEDNRGHLQGGPKCKQDHAHEAQHLSPVIAAQGPIEGITGQRDTVCQQPVWHTLPNEQEHASEVAHQRSDAN